MDFAQVTFLVVSIFSSQRNLMETFHNNANTPSPWFVWFSLVRFSFVSIFKTVPKHLLHVVYSLFDRVNPLFVSKLVITCIIAFVCAFLACAEFF